VDPELLGAGDVPLTRGAPLERGATEYHLAPRMNTLLRTLCISLALLTTGMAWADVGRDDAAAVAQRLSSGRVLSVDKADAGGRPVWRVKVLTSQGEVRVILIDVASGRPV
jgi:hypothetical protein